MHPDLVDDEPVEQAPVETPRRATSARSRRGGGPAAAPDTSTQPPPDAAAGEPQETSESPDSGEAPEWLRQAREATDPVEQFKILSKNLPRDVLERDEVISGLVGHKADAMLRARQQAEIERQKREAAQNNDLYTLGELTQRELQEREAQAQQAAANQSGTFMDGVVLFQQSLDRTLQEKVAGRTFGEGKGQAAGVAEYLQFLHDESVKLGVERELQRRESALRKSVLSEVNGDEPVPERESGTPGRVREVTDEQIEAMTMSEYNALFDENGRPKPGVRHRATRGIPLTQR